MKNIALYILSLLGVLVSFFINTNIYDYTEEEPALFPVPLPPPLLLLLLLTFYPVRCKIAWPKYELIVLTPAVAPSSALPPYS